VPIIAIMKNNNDKTNNERKQVLRRLLIATALCSFFLVVEVVGGFLAGSLAVLSDAAHLFADLASFAVAIAATYLASMPKTKAHTYGLKRSESLGALFSMTSLAFVTITLAFEAVRRLINPDEEPVDGKLMVIIASIGVVVNIALAIVLGDNHVHLPGSTHGHAHDHGPECHDEEEAHGSHDNHKSHDSHDHSHKHQAHDHSHGHQDGHDCDHHETESTALIQKKKEETSGGGCQGHDHGLHHGGESKKRNVNLQAAYIHVLGDLALSVAVLIAGLIIWFKPEWQKLDPIITIVFSGMVFYSTLGVLRTSVAVLLEETPSNISWQKVFEDISNIPCINNVHDLHIWSISHGESALTVHCSSDDPIALSEVYKVCKSHNINHSTVQIQPNDNEDCTTCTVSCMSQFE